MPAVVLATLTLAGRALVDPLAGVREAVRGRRWVFPTLLLALAVSLSGVAYGLKLDAGRLVIPALAQKGDLQKASEREISDEVDKAQRLALVAGVAKGVVVMPLSILALALALKLVAWLLVRPLPFATAFTAAAVSLLPIAVFHAVYAVAIWQQDFVTVRSAESLVPSSLSYLQAKPGALRRAYAAVDVFQIWSALLLGLGLSQALELKAWKGLLLGLFLYALFAAAALVGLPGLLEGLADEGGRQGGGRGR